MRDRAARSYHLTAIFAFANRISPHEDRLFFTHPTGARENQPTKPMQTSSNSEQCLITSITLREGIVHRYSITFRGDGSAITHTRAYVDMAVSEGGLSNRKRASKGGNWSCRKQRFRDGIDLPLAKTHSIAMSARKINVSPKIKFEATKTPYFPRLIAGSPRVLEAR